MSSMEIYGVAAGGDVEHVQDFRNAWLGPAYVWTAMADKFFGTYNADAEVAKSARTGTPFVSNMDRWALVWKLQTDPRLSVAEWTTLVTTFDHCIVPKQHMTHVAQQYEEFHRSCLKDAAIALPSHYHAFAELLRKMRVDGYEGACVNGTSVSANPWWVYPSGDDEDEEGRPYNILKDTKHWFFDPKERLHPSGVGSSPSGGA